MTTRNIKQTDKNRLKEVANRHNVEISFNEKNLSGGKVVDENTNTVLSIDDLFGDIIINKE